jgi:hypothetical protein
MTTNHRLLDYANNNLDNKMMPVNHKIFFVWAKLPQVIEVESNKNFLK